MSFSLLLRPAQRLVICPLLAGLLLVPAGCGRNRADEEPANLSITVEKGFVKRETAYLPWPERGDSLFSSSGSSHGGGGGNWNFGNDPRSALAAIAVLIALVVLAETVDVTYHNIHGLQLTVSVEGEGVYQSFPLRWGENHLHLSQFSLSRLADGSAALFLGGSGTRHLRLCLPTAGLDWERETHAIALLGSGDLIADGRGVAMPTTTPALEKGDDGQRR